MSRSCFWYKFNGAACFGIGPTKKEICLFYTFLHHFSIWIQPQQSLCNPEDNSTIKYDVGMVKHLSQCKFSDSGYNILPKTDLIHYIIWVSSTNIFSYITATITEFSLKGCLTIPISYYTVKISSGLHNDHCGWIHIKKWFKKI